MHVVFLFEYHVVYPLQHMPHIYNRYLDFMSKCIGMGAENWSGPSKGRP